MFHQPGSIKINTFKIKTIKFNHQTSSQNATHTTKTQHGRKESLDNSPAGGGAGGELSAVIKQNK
jgi:hypothetical protein